MTLMVNTKNFSIYKIWLMLTYDELSPMSFRRAFIELSKALRFFSKSNLNCVKC